MPRPKEEVAEALALEWVEVERILIATLLECTAARMGW
jgi:hypothetical protein